MKNTKSKIVVPALGLILLSTAASISGSVAWFTANRTAEINAGNFAVVKTSTDLQYALGTSHGVYVTGSEGSEAISLSNVTSETAHEETLLSDGSFDHLTSGYYIYTPDNTGTSIAKKVALASATDNSQATGLIRDSYDLVDNNGTPADDSDDVTTTYSVYTAVAWTITFKVSFGASGSNVALMMDHSAANKSNVKYWNGSAWTAFEAPANPITNTQNQTARGFRLAFLPGTGNTTGLVRVWADGESAANCKHILDQNTSTLLSAAGCNTAYESPYLIDQAYSTALPADDYVESVYTDRADCLGTIPFQANTVVERSFTCLAWYEGSDPFIVNQNSADGYQKVQVQMNFEIKNIGDTPAE